MKKIVGALCLLPVLAQAQKVEIQPVDIIYGNQVIHGQHQVVINSPGQVDIIPAEKKKSPKFEPNVVVTATGEDRSYLEEKAIAAREQAIYDEVNQRTKDAPFTVLFTGHIPDDIQEKRLRMLPEIGMFGDQLNKLENNQSSPAPSPNASQASVKPKTGDFSEITPGAVAPGSAAPTAGSATKPTQISQPTETQQQKLEKLIGGG